MAANNRENHPEGPGAIAPGLSELLGGGLSGLVGTSRKQLEETRVTGSAGGSAVVVTVNGEGRLTDVQIAPEVLADGVDTLQELILAACAEAFEGVQQAKSSALGHALSGLGLDL